MFFILSEPAPAGFMFWFLTELFFAAVVVALLYFFIIKNPKINPRERKDEEED
jgi:hypothetical protein